MNTICLTKLVAQINRKLTQAQQEPPLEGQINLSEDAKKALLAELETQNKEKYLVVSKHLNLEQGNSLKAIVGDYLST